MLLLKIRTDFKLFYQHVIVVVFVDVVMIYFILLYNHDKDKDDVENYNNEDYDG